MKLGGGLGWRSIYKSLRIKKKWPGQKKKNSCERSTVIINFPSLIQRGVLLIYKQYKKKCWKCQKLWCHYITNTEILNCCDRLQRRLYRFTMYVWHWISPKLASKIRKVHHHAKVWTHVLIEGFLHFHYSSSQYSWCSFASSLGIISNSFMRKLHPGVLA